MSSLMRDMLFDPTRWERLCGRKASFQRWIENANVLCTLIDDHLYDFSPFFWSVCIGINTRRKSKLLIIRQFKPIFKPDGFHRYESFRRQTLPTCCKKHVSIRFGRRSICSSLVLWISSDGSGSSRSTTTVVFCQRLCQSIILLWLARRNRPSRVSIWKHARFSPLTDLITIVVSYI